jgi:hypothetical protein
MCLGDAATDMSPLCGFRYNPAMRITMFRGDADNDMTPGRG